MSFYNSNKQKIQTVVATFCEFVGDLYSVVLEGWSIQVENIDTVENIFSEFGFEVFLFCEAIANVFPALNRRWSLLLRFQRVK